MALRKFLIFCLCSIPLLQLATSSLDAPCSRAEDFACDFETECQCWRQGENGAEDDIDWSTGTQVTVSGWNSIPRSRSETNSTFAYALRDGDHLLAPIPRGAMLVSKRLPCLNKPATLKLWYWKAAFIPQIKICYKFPNSPIVGQCSAEVNGFQPPDWLPLVVTLPPINKEFQIVIQATRLIGFQTVVAVDDITIDGDFTCDKNATDKITTPALIEKANTTFGSGNKSNNVALALGGTKTKFCPDVKLAHSWSGDYNRGVWQPCENGTKCKQHTGIGSATAWNVQGDGTYVLESQEFRLETKSVLKFQYHFAEKSFTSKLRLCVDTLDACPFVKRGSTQIDQWSEELMPLSAGWHKIYFTVTNLKKSDHVKVRRISVRTKDDDPSAINCTLMMTLIDE